MTPESEVGPLKFSRVKGRPSLLVSKGRCELDFLCAALRTMNHVCELAKIEMGAARVEEAGVEQRISLA
jgi:hypothetical protein